MWQHKLHYKVAEVVMAAKATVATDLVMAILVLIEMVVIITPA